MEKKRIDEATNDCLITNTCDTFEFYSNEEINK